MNLYQKSICIAIFFSITVNGQNNNSQAAFYNIATGAVIGGIGAMINKKKDQNLGHVLLKGIGQGAIGGYIVFESKRMVRKFADSGNYAYVWPSKIINSAGNSVILNAASNINLWERYYMNLGFIHFQYDIKAQKKLKIRLLPYSLISAVYGFTQGSFDMRRTLYTGQFFFVSQDIDDEFRGLTFANHIMLSKTLYEFRKNTIAHEIIHSYQYEGLMGTNAFFTNISKNLNETKFFGKKYGDIFYTDWNGLISGANHGLHLLFNVPYSQRFYEKEAAFYSLPRQ